MTCGLQNRCKNNPTNENTNVYENPAFPRCHRDAIGPEKCHSQAQNPDLKTLAEMIRNLTPTEREALISMLKLPTL